MVNAPTLGEVESAADTMRSVIADMGKEPEDAVEEAFNGKTEEIEDGTGNGLENQATGDQPDATDGADGRARDDKGRFVAKDKSDAGGEPGDDGADAAGDSPNGVSGGGSDVAASGGDDEVDPLEPLPEWTAEQHETFRAAPREVQQFILDQVTTASQKAEEAGKSTGKYAEIEEILAPRRDALARDGLTEAGYLRQLTALSDFAGKDARGFVQWFMQQRGIDPAEFIQQPDESEVEFDDPVYQRLAQSNAQLQQKLDNLERTIQNQQLTSEQTAQQRLVSEIESFGKAADDKGRLQHPYFDQVKPLMGSIMRAGRASDLKTAYDMACRADPDVNAKIVSAQRAQEERDRQKQNRAKAEAARQAGSSVSGTPGDRAAPEPTGDIREDMRRLMAEKGMI